MYSIDGRTVAMEKGDNVAFVRDGGGKMQVFVGEYGAMKLSNSSGGPHTYIEGEMVILNVLGDMLELQDKKTLKAVGNWLAEITISGNAVANELKIVNAIRSLKRGEMPE